MVGEEATNSSCESQRKPLHDGIAMHWKVEALLVPDVSRKRIRSCRSNTRRAKKSAIDDSFTHQQTKGEDTASTCEQGASEHPGT